MDKAKVKKVIQNIHDANFKHNFGSKKVARDFLKHNLPPQVLNDVDLDSLRIENSEFAPTLHRSRRRTDILYSLSRKSGKRIYTLLHLEAQTKHDKYMAVRLWEYHAAIARAYLKQEHETVPLILTFVLYYGREAWTSPKRISDLFDDFDLYVSSSLKTPFLIHLPNAKIADLKTQGAAAAPQIIMAKQPTREYCNILKELHPLMKEYGQSDPENVEYLATLDVHGALAFLEEFSNFEPETAKDFKSMFEVATAKTREEGIKLGKREIIERLLSSGMKEEEVARALQINLKRVKDILK